MVLGFVSFFFRFFRFGSFCGVWGLLDRESCFRGGVGYVERG